MMHYLPKLYFVAVCEFFSLIVLVYLFWRVLVATISFTVNITINPAAPPPLAAVNNPLNLTGTVGQPFTADLSQNVTGGTPPVTLTVQGTLPDGLTQSGNVISGTPTTPGTTTLSVTATDSGA